MDNWTPITDSLPKRCGNYLVTVKYTIIDVARPDRIEPFVRTEIDFYDTTLKRFVNRRSRFEEIIAWQPIPTPYMPEGCVIG